MISPTHDGEFASALRRVIERFKPRNVIETGTYLGEGTTRILHESLTAVHGGDKFTLVTIEANREYFSIAADRWEKFPEVVCLLGLTIPREQLPSLEQIQRDTVDNVQPGIYYDHPPGTRAKLYFNEQTADGPDKMLWVACGAFGFKPDMVLLDSAGHLGWLEFQYLMSLVKGPFVLICDDRLHVKHDRTYRHIFHEQDWLLIEQGEERFGWFIARFNASETAPAPPQPPGQDRA